MRKKVEHVKNKEDDEKKEALMLAKKREEEIKLREQWKNLSRED